MSVRFVCPKCGHEHPSVSVFCVTCGARMGTPVMRDVREPIRWGRMAGDVARSVVLLLVLAAIVLMLWPAVPAGAEGPDGAAFDGRVRRLQTAAQRGRYADETIAESEINGYLAECVKELTALPRSDALPFAPRRVSMRIRDGGVRIAALGACGPLPLSFEVDVAAPSAAGGEWRLRGGRVGRLSFPGGAARWIGRRFQDVFGPWDRERDIVVRARRVECVDGRIRVVVGGGTVSAATAPGGQP